MLSPAKIMPISTTDMMTACFAITTGYTFLKFEINAKPMKPKFFVSGCYDLHHGGHIEFFRRAAGRQVPLSGSLESVGTGYKRGMFTRQVYC